MSISGEGDPFDELKIRRYFMHFFAGGNAPL